MLGQAKRAGQQAAIRWQTLLVSASRSAVLMEAACPSARLQPEAPPSVAREGSGVRHTDPKQKSAPSAAFFLARACVSYFGVHGDGRMS